MAKIQWDYTARNMYKVLMQLLTPLHLARTAYRKSKKSGYSQKQFSETHDDLSSVSNPKLIPASNAHSASLINTQPASPTNPHPGSVSLSKSLSIGEPPTQSNALPPSHSRVSIAGGEHRFKLASRYAQKVMKDPDRLHSYGELQPDAPSFYKLAFNDALVGPKLGEPILRTVFGNMVNIIVPATDNVGVAQVEFVLTDAQKQVLAEGNGSKAKHREEWTCKTRCTMEQLAGAQLFIKASDLAGNQAIIRKTL
ncbi:hypothetical protein [Flavihumibacter sp.]|uniref:hypothetical protein n=1 Tax=Flavihumibacter sp. TaxID=1913981 RepID=UPI002FC74B23